MSLSLDIKKVIRSRQHDDGNVLDRYASGDFAVSGYGKFLLLAL